MSNPQYDSFLVRLWREPTTDGEWIAQVEHIPSGEIKYFASLDELFDYLRDRYSPDKEDGDPQ
jgi:hypothetical protein